MSLFGCERREHPGKLEDDALRIEREAGGAPGQGGGPFPQAKRLGKRRAAALPRLFGDERGRAGEEGLVAGLRRFKRQALGELAATGVGRIALGGKVAHRPVEGRSEEHTSELQSLMRISYAVFCLKKKTHTRTTRV